MADFQNFAQSMAEYNSTLPTIADGEASVLQLDANGRLVITTSGASLDVTATDLDIRNLAHTQDSVSLGDGTNLAIVNASGQLLVLDANSASILTELQSLTHAEDVAHISGDLGIQMLAVRQDIQADFGADGDYVPLSINADGELRVASQVTVQAGDAEYLEDSAHASGDAGIHMLAVRQDTLASSVSADGDYGSFKLNADGALYVTDVSTSTQGVEADAHTDSGAGGDALVAITDGTVTELLSFAVGAGTSYHIHALNWMADIQGTFRFEVRDGATLVETIRIALNAGSHPGDQMNFGKPIEITGAATRVLRVTFTRSQNKNGQAAAAYNGETF